jgi:50S ribosomal subunit-associated GTPase HflX
VLDASPLAGPERDPLADFDTINAELRRYAPELAERRQIVVLAKVDVTEVAEAREEIAARFAARGVELHTMSAVTGEGVREILEALWAAVQALPRPLPLPTLPALPGRADAGVEGDEDDGDDDDLDDDGSDDARDDDDRAL